MSSQEHSGHDLTIDDTSSATIASYLEDGFEPRIFNPLQNAQATDLLMRQRKQWAETDKTVVFTSGVFDVFHANHRSYLMATRLVGVSVHYNSYEASRSGRLWQETTQIERKEFTHHALAEEAIKQIVSVDGDMAVARRKGFIEEKGNIARPIYSWNSRVRDVLSASYTAPDESGARFLADIATIHDNQEPELQNGPHAGIMEMGYGLQPDVWAIYHESQDIIQSLLGDGYNSNTANMQAIIVEQSDGIYSDELLGGPFSTTALAKRMGGK